MLQTKPLTYSVIRREFQSHSLPEEVLVDHYTKAVSPVFTRVLMRWNLLPNSVTVGMILSGVLGAVLFSLPFVAGKIAGLIFIHVWFILDCSDGEVARITQRFSKFGTEMDYLAHAVCHPLFNLAFAWSLIELLRYRTSMILATALVSISAEMLLRHLTGLSNLYQRTVGQKGLSSHGRSTFRVYVTRLLGIFYIYPNFALLFPVLYLVDRFAGTSLALAYLVAQAGVTGIVSARAAVRWIRVIRPI